MTASVFQYCTPNGNNCKFKGKRNRLAQTNKTNIKSQELVWPYEQVLLDFNFGQTCVLCDIVLNSKFT